MGRTIATPSQPLKLTNPVDNPVTILPTGQIISGGSYAIWGTAATAWTIENSGQLQAKTRGVTLDAGGTVTNALTNASIRADLYGVDIENAAGRVVNYGTIKGSGIYSNGAGVQLMGGGTIVNGSTTITKALIEGGQSGAIYFNGGSDRLVINHGSINGLGDVGIGVQIRSGGTVVNGASNNTAAQITALHDGIAIVGSTGTLVNYGTVIGLGAANYRSYGLYLAGGGPVTNGTDGSFAALIRGGHVGVEVRGSSGTIRNAGTITGDALYGVQFYFGGDLKNASTGVITGGQRAVNFSGFGSGTVINYGRITGGDGIAMPSTGVVFNAGTVEGTTGFAVFAGLVSVGPGGTFKGKVLTDNLELTTGASQGTLSGIGTQFIDAGDQGTNAVGLMYVDAGASWALAGSNTITSFATLINFGTLTNMGTLSGVGVLANTSVLRNAGSLDSQVTLTSHAYLLNQAGATMSGAVVGLKNTETLTNFGTIAVPDGTAINFSAGGTVTNAGLISTGGSNALSLAVGYPNLLVVEPGATFIGTVDGGYKFGAPSHSTLELASAATQGTISGFGSQFVNFDRINIDPGAVWHLDGGNTLSVGATLTDRGSLLLTSGTLSDKGPAIISGSGGTFADATVSTAVWIGASDLVVGDAGQGSLLIRNGGSVLGVGNAVIADQAGSDGSGVQVIDAGSEWSIIGKLVVGDAGFGRLAIDAGGVVTANQLSEGAQAGGAGVISVIGKGSHLSLGGALTIGEAASAELSILNGATVSAANAVIGSSADATGNVDIEGAGSHLDIANDLNIGMAGVGVLTLGNNTELTVVNFLNIGTSGVLNSFGGIIDPAVVNNTGRAGGKGQISASVSIVNSGTLFASAGTETLIAPIITSTGVLEIDAGGNLAVNVGSVVATQTVTFTDGTGILTIGTLGGFAATIGSYLDGDLISVPGTAIATTHFDSSTHVLTLFDASQNVAGTLQFGSSITNGSSILVNGVAPCFAAGTRIATERGEVCVEALRIGDRVQTVLDGRSASLIWLGQRRVDCTRHPRPEQVWPVRVARGCFGPGKPARDVYLSPDHALYVADVLIPAKYLINGDSIAQVPCDEVTYYHVELPQHSVLLAEGLPAESYLEAGGRSNFSNGGDIVALHPDFAVRQWEAAACAPLVVSGATLVAARRWIAAMAAQRLRTDPRDMVPRRTRRSRRGAGQRSAGRSLAPA